MTTPVAVGNGSWDVKVVLGTARVYEDGSAMFQAPARVPLYFQALDERGEHQTIGRYAVTARLRTAAGTAPRARS